LQKIFSRIRLTVANVEGIDISKCKEISEKSWAATSRSEDDHSNSTESDIRVPS